MYKHIYLNFGVISFMNKEMVTFIQLHTYKFGLVYIQKRAVRERVTLGKTFILCLCFKFAS